jgi:hypothetical protein
VTNSPSGDNLPQITRVQGDGPILTKSTFLFQFSLAKFFY